MDDITSKVTIKAGTTITLDDDGTGYAGYEVEDAYTTGAPSVLVYGTLNVNAGEAYGLQDLIGNFTRQVFDIEKGGTLNVSGGDATGYDGDNLSGTFEVDGTATISASGLAIGSEDWGSGKFINTGTVTVTGGDAAIGVAEAAYFDNSGSITVTGGADFTTGVSGSALYWNNSGSIAATDTAPGAGSVAILASGSGTFTNSGTVQGTFAFAEFQAITIHEAQQQIVNSGAMTGQIDLGVGNDELDNSGALQGVVALGVGHDVYSGTAASSAGPIYGGFGDDLINTGDAKDTIFGDEGNDFIDAGAGNDMVDGGRDNDTLAGGAGNDKLYGGYGDDVLQGGDGNDVLDGWQGADTYDTGDGNDVIVISQAAFSTGAGFDTAVGFNFVHDRFELSAAPTTINAGIASGALSGATFGADLATAADAAHLSAHGAVLFTPTSGDYAGSTFMIVDQNGVAGYQDGADIVVRLEDSAGISRFGLSTFEQGASAYTPEPILFDASVGYINPYYGSAKVLFDDYTVYKTEVQSFHFTQQGSVAAYALMDYATESGDYHTPSLVTVAGSVDVAGTNAQSVYGVTTGLGETPLTQTQIWVQAGASFSVTSMAASSFAQFDGDGFDLTIPIGPAVRNDGDITITSAHNAFGVCSAIIAYTTDHAFTNTGTLTVSAVDLAMGAAVTGTVENAGAIDVNSGTVAGLGVECDGRNITSFTAGLINSGSIVVTDQTAALDSVAIKFLPTPEGAELDNSGLIQADYVIDDARGSVPVGEPGYAVINSGTLAGIVSLSDTIDTIHNSGTITGDVLLYGADDVFDGAGGTYTGTLDGGDGNDVLSAGAGTYTLLGGAGNDLLVAGRGTATMDGGDGNDTLSFVNASAAVSFSLTATGVQHVAGGTLAFANMENVAGSQFNDTLTGDSGNNILSGGAGDDTLNGNGGSDTAGYGDALSGVHVSLAVTGAQDVGGGLGHDTLVGISNLLGSSFDDVLTGNGQANVLSGGAGNDLLISGAGNDTLDGGDGSDTATYAAANSGIAVDLSQTAAQSIGGGFGAQTLISVENIIGSAFDDVLTGNAADNRFAAGAGNDTITGNGGSDWVDYSAATSAIKVDLNSTSAQNIGGGQGTDTLNGISSVLGSAFSDTLSGTSKANIFEGGAGNDSFRGGGGLDIAAYGDATAGVSIDLSAGAQHVIGGGDGTDTYNSIEGLIGSNFDDVLAGDTGNNSLSGGAGNDTLIGNGGSDTLDGGDGSDTVDFSNDSSAVTMRFATLATDASGTDTLVSIENITGTAFADTLILIGSSTDNILSGGAGNDALYTSGGGHDTVLGGAGADKIFSDQNLGAGDRIDGGSGNDTLFISAYGAQPGLQLPTADLRQASITSVEALSVSGVSVILGDNLVAKGKTMTVDFNDGATIDASAETDGNFVFHGGLTGGNTIIGGAGNDTFDGGAGADHFIGNGGADLFSYSSYHDSGAIVGAGFYDTITGFDATQDHFHIKTSPIAIGAAVVGGAVDQAEFAVDIDQILGTAQLAPRSAILFTPTRGDLAGIEFLVVDLNGKAGFQSSDLVIALDHPVNMSSFSLSDFI